MVLFDWARYADVGGPRSAALPCAGAVPAAHPRPHRLHPVLDPPRVPRGAGAVAFPLRPSFRRADGLAGRVPPARRGRGADAPRHFVPVFVLGFSPVPFTAYVLRRVQAAVIHANVRTAFDRCVACLTTPEFHHWHHAGEPAAVDKNFAVQLPVWTGCSARRTCRIAGRRPTASPTAPARRADICGSSCGRSGVDERLRAAHPSAPE